MRDKIGIFPAVALYGLGALWFVMVASGIAFCTAPPNMTDDGPTDSIFTIHLNQMPSEVINA